MFRVMGFLLVLLAAAAQAGTDGFTRVTQQLTPRVHLVYRPVAINAPYEGNSIVIEQSDGLVVVDAGGAPPASTTTKPSDCSMTMELPSYGASVAAGR